MCRRWAPLWVGGDTWEGAQAVLGGAVSSPPINALTSMG